VTYNSQGTPVSIGQTGQRAFCSDQSGVIRFAADGSGTTCLAGSTALQ
jgi:hypothetical protein